MRAEVCRGIQGWLRDQGFPCGLNGEFVPRPRLLARADSAAFHVDVSCMVLSPNRNQVSLESLEADGVDGTFDIGTKLALQLFLKSDRAMLVHKDPRQRLTR